MKQLFTILIATVFVVGVEARAASAAPPAPTESTITFFYYESLDEVAPFYEETLGLEKTLDMDWVKIYQVSATSSVGLTKDGHGFHRAAEDKPAMLSIVTEDVDAWYARAKQTATPILSDLPPEDDTSAPDAAPIRGFIMEDPGGYTIEVFSWR